MPVRPPLFRPAGARTKRERGREHDRRRRATQAWRGWYQLKAWLDARAAQLARQPLCERCLAEGFVETATTVHHRVPHRGDWALFIDPGNHESACKPCHDGVLQAEERAGRR